jgi:hypothetical protein
MIYRTLLFLSIPFIALSGKEIESFPSFQGFEGVVNTPNSEVLQEGEFQFLYTNQVDNFSPSSSSDFRDNKKQESYFLNMGFLPNLDFSLRYSHGTNQITNSDYLSDRIINFKYQIPFIPNDIVKVAFGMQDVGGRAQHLSSKYMVASKELENFRTSVGFAQGEDDGALDGAFGSIEYQPLSWLQVAGEYDTKEWNGVIKSHYSSTIADKKVNLGLMAKSSLDYNDVYLGVYTNISFQDNKLPLPSKFNEKTIPSSIESLKEFGFSNVVSEIKDDTIFFEYENTLYVYNDIDALGVVLGTLAMSNKASTIVVTMKKSNIAQYRVKINTKQYKNFLTTGKYEEGLLKFISNQSSNNSYMEHSDRFKPTITVQPDFVLVDGSEYGHMDYTLAMQTELSMRLAQGTIFSARYNVPLSITDNFKDHGIFDYRNRNKTTSSFDQVLLSQFFQFNLPYHWINLIQVGQFDKELTGFSFESGISDLSGKHALLLKLSSLNDNLANQMDLYIDEEREEKLLSYRYYLESLNSNIKITGGEFLYGDRGVSISFKRYFSDVSVQFDVAQTEHDFKGSHKVGKLTLSIPFGANKRFKSKYLDVKGDYMSYNRRKTLVSKNDINNISQPHHLKEINNNFTLEKYYLDSDRFHPAYIKANYNRLRNVFLRD